MRISHLISFGRFRLVYYVGPFLEIVHGGCRTYVLPTKMGAVPMIEDYLFIREDFMNGVSN